jgi:RHS repeat-associated protein
MIGSTLATSDGSGTFTNPTVHYTAFGERVVKGDNNYMHFDQELPEGFPRYGYAGAYGYESGPWGMDTAENPSAGPLVLYGANRDLPPITLMHVGERWYQPSIGRFVQRDPIGIAGGLNVYGYCLSSPVQHEDEEGLYAPNIFEKVDAFIDSILGGNVGAGAGAVTNAGTIANYKYKWKIGKLCNRANAIMTGAVIGWRAGKEQVRHHNADRVIGDPIGQWIVDILGLGPPGYDGRGIQVRR